MLEFIYENTFRDLGSGFDCYPIDYGTTCTQLVLIEIDKTITYGRI